MSADKEFSDRKNFRDFYESVAEHYPEEDLVYKTLRGIVRKHFILKFLGRFSGRLLDLGCNRGYYLSQYSGKDVVGIDIAHAVLKHARQRLCSSRLLVGDIQRLGFLKANSVDSILCSEVIEHVPEPERVFFESFRVLRPGGRALFTTPNYRGRKPEWTAVGEMSDYGIKGVRGEMYYHTAFRPEELGRIATSAGFKVLEAGTFEKEVKYATRIPVTFYYMLDFLFKKVVRSDRLQKFNKRMLDSGSLLIYRVCGALRLNSLMVSFVREGVRSYIFLEKGE
jgi:2-polyprenyl-6-hydroxyphenyl methylase/3-demethylubiquinone-9 3-methyltransferase